MNTLATAAAAADQTITSEYTKALTPVNGLLVIDPATSRALPDSGAVVKGNAQYWVRRLNDGEVSEIELPAADDAPPDNVEATTS